MTIYKTIVSKIAIPAEKKIKQKQYLIKGAFPIVDQGQKFIGGYTDDCSKLISCDLPVIVFGDHSKAVKYIDFPFCAGADGIKILKANANISPKYLYYGTLFLTYCIQDKGYARHYQFLEKEKLLVPSLAEQELIVSKIEELFSQLDDAISELRKAKEKLNVYRQAVLKEAFQGDLTKEWRANHPSDSADHIWETICEWNKGLGRKKQYSLQEKITLPSLPSEWKWVFIGDISSGPEYGTSQKSSKIGKVPVIRMGNMQNGRIVWDDLVFSNDEQEIKNYCLYDGDVLFNRTNSPELVGKTSIYRGERDAIFAGYLIRINQYKCISPEYLTFYMNSFIAKKYGQAVKTDAVNQSNINATKLCSYPFPLCSIEEQKQIVYELECRLSLHDQIEQCVNDSLLKVEALRQTILKLAFEGKL